MTPSSLTLSPFALRKKHCVLGFSQMFARVDLASLKPFRLSSCSLIMQPLRR